MKGEQACAQGALLEMLKEQNPLKVAKGVLINQNLAGGAVSMLFIFLFIFTRTGENRTDHTASSLLASSFRIASGTSSPCSFVDTRSSECGAGPECDAGVVGSHGLACLSCLPSRLWCAHSARHTAMIQQPPANDESAVGGAHESEEEPGIHFANLSCSQ